MSDLLKIVAMKDSKYVKEFIEYNEEILKECHINGDRAVDLIKTVEDPEYIKECLGNVEKMKALDINGDRAVDLIKTVEDKVQCDSEEEVIKLLIDKRYYELSEKEKLEKREIKALANCINNKMQIVEDADSEDIENKFIIKDEITYVLSLLITNKIILLERIDSNIYTANINKSEMKDNYVIVNKFAKELLKIYLK